MIERDQPEVNFKNLAQSSIPMSNKHFDVPVFKRGIIKKTKMKFANIKCTEKNLDITSIDYYKQNLIDKINSKKEENKVEDKKNDTPLQSAVTDETLSELQSQIVESKNQKEKEISKEVNLENKCDKDEDEKHEIQTQSDPPKQTTFKLPVGLTGLDEIMTSDDDDNDDEINNSKDESVEENITPKYDKNKSIDSPSKISSQNPFIKNRLNIVDDIILKSAKSCVSFKDRIPETREEIFESLDEEQKHKVMTSMIEVLEELDSKLQSANSELERTKSIEEAKRKGLINPLDLTESKLHFAFMFASPLIINSKSNANLPQLDFNSELRNIESDLKELEYEVIFRSSVATKESISSIICGCPLVLHFTGHGIDNTLKHQKLLGFSNNIDQGDALILEDPLGKCDVYFESDLKAVSNFSHNSFEVVVVSACHSENIGKVFLNAGAKHVICILKDEEISDKASVLFSKIFYHTLFQKQLSVCEAFDIAKNEVRVNINVSESSKFIKLIPEEQKSSKKKHKCSKIFKMNKGTILNITPTPTFDLIPSKVDVLIGREQALHQILKLLLKSRLVILCGPQGIGKTSVARQVSNFCMERQKFKDGILYINLKKCKSAEDVFTTICIQIRNFLNETQLIDMINESSIDDEDKCLNEIDMDKKKLMEKSILKILKHKEVLLILDQCNDLFLKDSDNFNDSINLLLDYCYKLKILLVTDILSDNCGVHVPKIVELNPLPKELSIKLLILKCQRGEDISFKEKEEFLECTPEGESNSTFKYSLSNHPLNNMLQGHPQAISLASTLLNNLSLKELYLNFMNFYDSFDSDDIFETSIKLSQMVNLIYVESNKIDAIKLLVFISLFSQGADEEELKELWNECFLNPNSSSAISSQNIDSLLSTLLSFNLIQCSSGNDEKIYSILPSLLKYSKEYLSNNPETKIEFYSKMTKMMKDYMVEFYNSEKTMKDVEGLIGVEANVWACITKRENTDEVGEEDINKICEELLKRTKDLSLLEDASDDDKNEEMLAIYYSINMIWLNKNQEALNTVNAVLNKNKISKLGIANLCHIMATLLLISMNEKYFRTSMTLFKEEKKVFNAIGNIKGEAFGCLGIAQVLIYIKQIKQFQKAFEIAKSYFANLKEINNYEAYMKLLTYPEEATTDTLSLLFVVIDENEN